MTLRGYLMTSESMQRIATRFDDTLHKLVYTHVYALYKLYMLVFPGKPAKRIIGHIQCIIRLHVDIRSIIRIGNEKSVYMPGLSHSRFDQIPADLTAI